MASSAPKIAEEERQEAPDAVERKAKTLVDQIRKSKHFIAFTGAGISTSAGIPDFRGPEGVWTLRAQGRQHKTVNTLQCLPTPTHMALVELQNRGILKYLISQNCDGLHRKSGMLPDRISELHGNSNREYCKDCGKEYIRATAPYEKTVHDHRTGRKCARCGGALHDTIINFGESLPAQDLKRARDHAKKADLCLVLGSSLTVTPANEIPKIVTQHRGGKLAICNLQETPLDTVSDLRIHSKTDELMLRVMDKLGFPIPSFTLQRLLVVKLETKDDTRHDLKVSGVDVDGTPITFLRSVKLEHNRRVARTEPFIINIRGSLDPGTELKLQLEFMGNYGEPSLDLVYECTGERDAQTVYSLEYNPQNGEWKTAKQDSLAESDGTGGGVDKDEDTTMASTSDAGLPDNVKPTAVANSFPGVAV